MKKAISTSFALMIMLIALVAFTVSSYAAGYYVHDPMDNPKAAADIIVDPNAVYGYAPNPDSPRLGAFADYDWSDEAFVAQMRQEREDYHASVHELYQMKADMEAEGKSVEEIARAVSTRRNEIRMEGYKDDPEGLEKLKESNLATFGNENGGTPEYFYEKYGSWETVIEKAFSTNAGADAILGLYDEYYYTYFIDGDDSQIPSTEPVTETAAQPVTEQPTEPASVDQAKPVSNQSKTSPKTGDPAIAVLILVITSAVVAVICTTKLLSYKQE